MEKKEITRKLKEILSKHEGNTSEGAIYWDSEWVGGKQIPTGGGGYRQEGGKLVCKDKEFYQEMADFISQELDKAREEGVKDGMRGMIDILCEKGCGSMFAVIEEKDVNKKIEELSKLTTK